MYSRLGDDTAIDSTQSWDDGLDWDGTSVSYDAPSPAPATTFASQWLQNFNTGLLAPADPAPPMMPIVPTLAPIVSSAPYNYTPALALTAIVALALLARRA